MILKNVLISRDNLCVWWHVLVRQTLCLILDSPDSDQIINMDGLAFHPEKVLQVDAVSNAAFGV